MVLNAATALEVTAKGDRTLNPWRVAQHAREDGRKPAAKELEPFLDDNRKIREKLGPR